ncbi:MAG: CBS domain-containing protein [Candidatus Helarchaeota archaeon]|nr:CBS domain-containing protein [Candidatus Helarchaeota archaeon]
MKRISVQDIMTRNVIGVEQDVLGSDIIKLMSERRIGSVVVLDHGSPVGIITVRDILKKIAEKCIAPSSVSAKQLMSQPIVIIDPNVNLRNASLLLLQKGIKKLVVVENGKLRGLVTTTDIERVFLPFDSPFDMLNYDNLSGLAFRKEFQSDFEKKLIEDIMTKDVKTVKNSMKIFEIAKIMNETKIGSLVVVKDKKAIGIVTDLQIVRKVLNENLDPGKVTAEEGMEPLVSISPKDTLKSALEKMVNKTVKKLGVIDAGDSLVGIITTTDFLVYYRSLLFRPTALGEKKGERI